MLTELQLAVSLWRHGVDRAWLHRHRARLGDPALDRGASALEWAVISAILVTAAVIIGGIVVNVVKNKGSQLSNCANGGPNANGCP